MSGSLIVDTGPIIALSVSGHLELLRHLYDKVIVPEQVDAEIRLGGQRQMGLVEYMRADWIEVACTQTVDPLLLAELDAGEAGVISLALQKSECCVLIDERKARKFARSVYRLNVLGTARLLIDAKRAGLIPCVKDILIEMRIHGYWIHDNIIDYALHLVGEE